MGTLGIIALILSAVGLLGQGVSSYLTQKKTNEFNQQQYEDWKEYNTPANQMSRLAEAGLNQYQVSGLNNTLSQPFQIGANTGLSEMFSGLSKSMYNSAYLAENSQIKRENLGIRRDEVQVKRDKLALDKDFLQIKRQLADSAIKRGDAQTALFWSSVDQKDLVNNYLRETMPFRIGSARYDFLNSQQSYNFNEKMNPLKLAYYAPYMRSIINKNAASAALANRQVAHLDWLEPFQLHQWNFHKYTEFPWQQDKYFMDMDYRNRRLGLSEQYFGLAQNKWLTGLLMDYLKGRKMVGRTSKPAGGYPTYDTYEYGW